MPCDSRVFIELDLKNPDPKIFVDAMKRLGHDAAREVNGIIYFGGNTYNPKTGSLTASRYGNTVDKEEIQRAYSREQAIKLVEKAGWGWKPNPKDQWNIQATKRTYGR